MGSSAVSSGRSESPGSDSEVSAMTVGSSSSVLASKLAGKTLYITGASRGIGKAIALKAAKDGARIVVAAKTAEPHPKLPGTIYTAAKEIEEAGGEALPCMVDVREEGSIQESIENAVKHFGGIDIVVNNASAINLTGTEATPMKRYDLMHNVNTRGTYLVSKLALPYLRASKNNPHILNISPPLNLNPRWFKDHVAYTMAKYGMSMCVLGMAEEFRKDRIAVNALWPKTAIITAAMEMLGGGKDIVKQCRVPEIMSDAAYVILTRDSRNFTGNFVIDESILMEEGLKSEDLLKYSAVPGSDLLPDFFLDEFDDAASKMNSPRFVAGQDVGKAGSSAASSKSVQSVFDRIASKVNEELVQKTQAVYTFKVEGSESGSWFVDLKNGSGSVGLGEPPQAADVFKRIKEVASAEIVKKVDATYLFNVEESGKFYVDLKNGEGSVSEGEPPVTPDVTIDINEANILRLFNREVKPATAFMTGQLKLSGDLTKAMALEAVMKASRGERTFHSWAVRRNFSTDGPAPYLSVPEVFGRIETVASKAIVAEVGAIYLFDVENEGKYYVDFKNGEGCVGQGDPADKPDVTINMSVDNFLKIFNRELSPATAFMTGQIKVSGDLAKALTLEKVMKAAREAATKK
eukprot:maker-scaffold128_size327099-snap-gene-1.9 protein:Tk06461 transcript:maker-scaffold128_size327099-snap-gene-1.9-mRNA-1 annotation:"hydroxysteroid dehydrogenase-like protein 2-like"